MIQSITRSSRGALIALVVYGACINLAVAEADPFKRGMEIIKISEENGVGFKDMTSVVKMTLLDGEKIKKVMEMNIKAIALESGEGKSLTKFTKPKREKGISLLTFTQSKGADQQWLYLPSTKRVKKIASSSKNSSFRGSDFTFEDLASQDSRKYNFELIKEEACGTSMCFVLDRTARTVTSSYSKTRLSIDTEHYRLYQAIFYGADNTPVKKMTISEYEYFEEKYWRPKIMVMEQLKASTSTVLEFIEVTFDTNLRENEFTELALKRSR